MAKVSGINKVAVIGAGLMGFGIGVDFARAGYEVWLYNTRDETSQLAMKRARGAFDRMVEGELLAVSEANAGYARLHPTTNMEQAAQGANYVVESVKESLAMKREVFKELDRICPTPTLLTTNTSSLTTTSIANDNVQHPERCCVAHYFQPPHFLPLVEIVGGEKTSKESIDRTYEILSRMGKKPVIIPVELPSHAGNRLQDALAREIWHLVDNKVCTPEMIDTIIMYGFGRRMANTGYFIRQDLIGLDLPYFRVKAKGGEPWGPFREHVERGELGMKSGKGFYDWPDHGEAKQRQQEMELIRFLKRDLEESKG
ncbi:MAG: 3-hydroxyacyl-CoA dehydrogenase family protein [Chloroflexi bacterium]|nr:3-hydroxyacyl-CoA dehydrogenase family protein [Chloroflexota bacterium]